MNNAFASSTSNTYNIGFRHYQTFCHQNGLPLFPLNDDTLSLFATHLAARMSQTSVRTYLAGVQCASRVRGFRERIEDMQKVRLTLRGIDRSRSSSSPRREAITFQHLDQIRVFLLSSEYSHQDRQLYFTASCVAFFGMLRVSEYTCPTSSFFDSSRHLCVSDVTISTNMLLIRIKVSKTNQSGLGTTIRLPSINSIFCPVAAMRSFLSLRGFVPGPLFMFANNLFLTRNMLSQFLRRVFNNIDINTHSFRIGGASCAAAAGISNSTIQILGRWSSSAFRDYLRFSNDSLRLISQSMCTYAQTQSHQ